MADLTSQLEALFQEAGQKHHEAFAETDGYDPEWATWYAAYVVNRLPPIMDADLSELELAGLFQYLSKKQPDEAPGTPWARFYAKYLIEWYGSQSLR
jgi:hypothetical protein